MLSGSYEISTNTSFINKLKMLRQLHDPSHKIRFSDLVDLWVIKKKKSMILCARSTWRLSEQSTKCRSRRHIFEEFMRCAKVCGLFSWLCFSDADWLGRQTPTTWRTSTYIRFSYQSVSWCFLAILQSRFSTAGSLFPMLPLYRTGLKGNAKFVRVKVV